MPESNPTDVTHLYRNDSHVDVTSEYTKKSPKQEILNETHPSISWLDRAIVKNLSTSPQSALAYLQKEYPAMEFSFDEWSPGDIITRAKGDSVYRRLDPKGFDIADLSDIGSDVLGAAGNIGATALGGVSGNLPGAIAAGGASSAAIEAARQGLGSLAGIPNNIDATDIGILGATGAVSPLLFGSGATTAQVAKQALKTSEKRVHPHQRGDDCNRSLRFKPQRPCPSCQTGENPLSGSRLARGAAGGPGTKP
jgi:hypothetical protein